MLAFKRAIPVSAVRSMTSMESLMSIYVEPSAQEIATTHAEEVMQMQSLKPVRHH